MYIWRQSGRVNKEEATENDDDNEKEDPQERENKRERERERETDSCSKPSPRSLWACLCAPQTLHLKFVKSQILGMALELRALWEDPEPYSQV